MNGLYVSGWPISQAIVERLGWVLVHSLWQFILVALVAEVAMRGMRRNSSAARYGVLVVALLASVSLPATTCILQGDTAEQSLSSGEPVSARSTSLVVRSDPSSIQRIVASKPHAASPADLAVVKTLSSESTATRATSIPSDQSWSEQVHSALRPWLAWIVMGWSVGVLLCSLRPLLGWLTLWRLRRVGVSPVSTDVLARMQQLAQRLGVRHAVQVLHSTLAQVPIVVGYLRPMILLPVSLMTSIPASQLDAILAHELAHIRRHDFIVNLLQTLIETLFFYHPAVWWLSRQIRIEREHCCDDLVVALLGDRVEYGRALLAVAELHGHSAVLALGASDGPLLSRIRRLTRSPVTAARCSTWWLANLVVMLVAISTATTVAFSNQSKVKSDSPPSPPASKRYIAELPDGAKVEFLGIAPLKEGPQKWWLPDGRPLADVPQAELPTLPKGEYRFGPRHVVIQVTGVGDNTAVSVNVDGSTKSGKLPSGQPFVAYPGALWYLPRQSTPIFEVRVATEPRSPVRLLDARGKKLPRPAGAAPDHIAEDIDVVRVEQSKLISAKYRFIAEQARPLTSEEKREQDERGIQTVITFLPLVHSFQIDIDMKLIDIDGKSHEVRSRSGFAERPEESFGFDVPLDRVSRFEYRMRPYRHLVTFKNVSLEPGRFTNVEVHTNTLRATTVIGQEKALQQIEAISDRFAAGLTKLKLSFIDDAMVAAMRQELRDSLASRIKRPVGKEWQQSVLQAVEIYCSDVFYRRFVHTVHFMRDFEMLKWHLWTAMDRDELTTAELGRRETQRDLFREIARNLPDPSGGKIGPYSLRTGGTWETTALIYKLQELEDVMTDPLNPYFAWPLTDIELATVQNGMRDQKWLVRKTDLYGAAMVIAHPVTELQSQRVSNRWPNANPAGAQDGFGKTNWQWDGEQAKRPLAVFGVPLKAQPGDGAKVE
ncbi:MAG: TonB domain/peptidase domain protein [Planctomycetaceae bacterium]|nr:TonB domain/peptidase domain protein [Planctomycetaceae bacterium]